ncbi:MAG: 2-oxoacid:acceptor oxidoreductase family protein, partial [Hyphomicrobiaceae bacterium]
MSGINDFVIKFATVNGSGSASANTMFAKTLFRMGIPVSPKNIFPSNIQGLPTWYEVRVSEAGYLARRDGIDLMVAMNPQTYKEDLAEVAAGGWLLYDSTLPRIWPRDDITVLGIPIAEMCAKKWTDPRQRQLFKNMVYVGALTALLDMDLKVVEGVVADQLKGKEKLVSANMEAVHLGREFAQANFKCPLPIRVRHADGAKGKIMVTGNDAAGLGAIYGGATACAWYPITPSTSLAEAFERYAKRLRVNKDGKRMYGIVQAEDELAAIGIAIGAGWNGARSFTATSGPGISLMSEFLGLAYFAEVPVVLFNIQRGGPSTGMPTRTQQSDIISCAYASHGDTKHVLLFPSNPTECFSLGAQAFDLAERLQTPVIVMSDLDIGMNDWMTDAFAWDDSKVLDRGKVLDAAALDAFKETKGADWGRYQDIDRDGIPYRTLPGTHPT